MSRAKKFSLKRTWQKLPYLADHRIGSTVVLPMSGFLELAVSAGWHAASRPLYVLDMQILSSLMLTPGQGRRVQVVVTPDETEATWRCQILARESSGWHKYAECRLAEVGASLASPLDHPLPTDAAQKVDPDEHYAHFRQRGLNHGSTFRGLRQLWMGDHEAWGDVDILFSDEHDGYLLHPAVLDACFQVVAGALGEAREGAWLPVSVARYELDLRNPTGTALRVYARQCPASEEETLQIDLDIRKRAVKSSRRCRAHPQAGAGSTGVNSIRNGRHAARKLRTYSTHSAGSA